MVTLTLNQAHLFYIFLLTGILIGLVFDVFRILRKSFKTSDFITYVQDILFWIITSIILLYTIFKFNNGEIRSYVFLGIGTGLLIYLTLFSKVFIKINVKIIEAIKSIIKTIFKIIFYPIKKVLSIIRKTIFKPISFVFINIRKNTTDILKNISKIKIKNKFLHKNPKNTR